MDVEQYAAGMVAELTEGIREVLEDENRPSSTARLHPKLNSVVIHFCKNEDRGRLPHAITASVSVALPLVLAR